jgi:hypothetical protein
MSTTSSSVEPTPHHLRPTTLHGVVLLLWIAVGAFTGLGLASAIGAVQLVDDQDLSITEHLAITGQHAGAYFAAAAVALGAIAVVEAVLLTVGHVAHVEQELEPVEEA